MYGVKYEYESKIIQMSWLPPHLQNKNMKTEKKVIKGKQTNGWAWNYLGIKIELINELSLCVASDDDMQMFPVIVTYLWNIQ